MKLRDRFVLALFVIALILSGPAVYGLVALRQLEEVAQNLRGRDAVGALALGRLQAAFSELESNERIYLALADGPDRNAIRGRVRMSVNRVDAELARLRAGGYESGVDPAIVSWGNLRAAIEQEHQLIESRRVEAADLHRGRVVDSAFVAMDRALDPIGRMINAGGAEEVERARTIATRASTTTLLALGVALALAVLIGAWLARTLLTPIHDLRRAMTVVANGDFEPNVTIPPDRRDEIGDLGRSFRWMTSKLAELERLRAQFVAVASHELKTPLSVIKGYVSLIREGIYGPSSPEQQKVLTAVSDQSDRLGRLIQQLLDISRFEAGGAGLRLHPLDVRMFMRELAVSFEALALQNDIDFRLDLEEGVPEIIHADADRLNEVIGNLLSNAFKFTPRRGEIHLRGRAGEHDADGEVVIEVSDTGVGIPPDKLPHVFEKFFQVENEAQPLSVGSGLGLAIAKEIVEAHQGTITAESQVGRGTTFRVHLPVSPSDRIPSPRPAEAV